MRLAEFGQRLYEAGGAVPTPTLAILAIVDARQAWRRQISVAWGTVAMWKELAPSWPHVPMPYLLL